MPLAMEMMSGVTPKACAAKGLPRRPEAGNHFIEDQQDSVPVADLAETLQVALGRNQCAGRPGNGFDDAGRDRVAVGLDQPFEVIGQLGAVLGPALGEAVFRQPGVTQVQNAGKQRAERFAIPSDTPDGQAAEIHAVIGTLAADQPDPLSLAPRSLAGQRDLECSLHRLGARASKKETIEVRRSQPGELPRQLERTGKAELEVRCIVQLSKLAGNRLANLGPAVSCRHTEKPRAAVENLLAAVIPVVHSLGFDLQPGVGFEITVGRERHPVVIESCVGRVFHRRFLWEKILSRLCSPVAGYQTVVSPFSSLVSIKQAERGYRTPICLIQLCHSK